MLSRTATHALRALIVLAGMPQTEFAGAAMIASRIGAPQNYMGKLLQLLAREGVVASQRGHGGGFRLARSPDAISLYDIVEPIDKVSRQSHCLLGQMLCGAPSVCTVHDDWTHIVEAYLGFLKRTTLARLLPPRKNPERT